MALSHRRSVSGVKLGENSHSSSFSARERIENEKFLSKEKKANRLKSHGFLVFGSTGEPKGPARMPSLQELKRAAKKES